MENTLTHTTVTELKTFVNDELVERLARCECDGVECHGDHWNPTWYCDPRILGWDFCEEGIEVRIDHTCPNGDDELIDWESIEEVATGEGWI